MRSNSSGSTSMIGLSIMMPAMLHMTCSPPWRVAMCCTSVSAAPRAATLSSALSARPPWPRMAAAVSAAVALLMSAQTTVAPAPASTSAVERPMPLPAPVTRATRPVRSNALRTLWAVSMRRTLCGDTLQREQCALARESAPVAADAVARHHAVAGHDDGNRVLAVGLSHCTRPPRPPDAPGQLAVADGLTVGNACELGPHLALERGSVEFHA